MICHRLVTKKLQDLFHWPILLFVLIHVELASSTKICCREIKMDRLTLALIILGSLTLVGFVVLIVLLVRRHKPPPPGPTPGPTPASDGHCCSTNGAESPACQHYAARDCDKYSTCKWQNCFMH